MILSKKEIRDNLSLIPEQPGCYIYRDEEDKVIYVGKAKNLKKRISSYFNREPDSRKTRALLRAFTKLEYMVVSTEHDALLLENNLIKQHQPHYNILLKQGNMYPYICVKNETFPRVFVTHKMVRDGSLYYGPYPNRGMAWTLIRLFRQIFKFRSCSLKLTTEGIDAGKYRVCLKYHIDRCLGPCVGYQSEEEYNKNIEQAKQILEGRINSVTRTLREQMLTASENLDFEAALEIQKTLEDLESYQGKSTIISNVIGDALVASYRVDADALYVNYLLLREGNIIAGRTLEYKKQIEDEEKEELFATVLQELLDSSPIEVRELIVEEVPNFGEFPGVKITTPQRGDRRKVLALSIKNVEQYKKDKIKQQEKLNPEQRNTQILKNLMQAAGLTKLPYHVESFDNSNISGSDPVASCVVFKGARPSKKDYRLYRIKGVNGPDDYASMHEVVVRRYSRLKEEGEQLPDLIITDGGKGQMSTVKRALREVGVEIPVMGLAKDETHNTNQVLYGDPPQVIGIMQRSEVFYLLERIQKEVHRFAINYHRKLRSKRNTHSELDDIKGIGPANKQKLLKHFKSVKRIKAATKEELQEVLGASKGATVYTHFHTPIA